METISTNWRLCKIASIISCIVFVLWLNPGRGNLRLLDDRSLVMSATSTDPISSFELLEAARTMKKDNPVEEKAEEKCNVFYGNWVYDPQSVPPYTVAQCPFINDEVSCQRNGRPDSEYEKWRWEAKGCDLPRFDGRKLLETLRGKRVILVGDSLNRNQWEALVCLLHSVIPSSESYIQYTNGLHKIFKAMNYNCSVEFYWSPFLAHLEEKKGNASGVMRLGKLPPSAEKWRGADVMLFNTGHWWLHRGRFRGWDQFQTIDGELVEEMEIGSAFGMAMTTWSRWIDENVDRMKTRVFFRSVSPEHKGKKSCYNSTQPNMDGSYKYAFPEAIQENIEITIQGMKTPVTFMNITILSGHRIDAHPSIYGTTPENQAMIKQGEHPEYHSDCSHWCLPGIPDTWNQLWFASMVLDSQKDFSS